LTPYIVFIIYVYFSEASDRFAIDTLATSTGKGNNSVVGSTIITKEGREFKFAISPYY